MILGEGERERERERQRDRERERNINVSKKHRSIASLTALTGDHTCNLGMCRDQESNLQPLGVRHEAPNS